MCRPYGSGWHSVTELTLALLHNTIQWRGWPHEAEQRRDTIPKRRQRAGVAGILL
jgi:hypothetical protein